MRRFVEGKDRGQWTLLPECLDPKGGRRDGPLGPGLQSDPGYEHRRDQAADRCDHGLSPGIQHRISPRGFLHGQDPMQTSWVGVPFNYQAAFIAAKPRSLT
jgi:hypothetical protein